MRWRGRRGGRSHRIAGSTIDRTLAYTGCDRNPHSSPEYSGLLAIARRRWPPTRSTVRCAEGRGMHGPGPRRQRSLSPRAPAYVATPRRILLPRTRSWHLSVSSLPPRNAPRRSRQTPPRHVVDWRRGHHSLRVGHGGSLGDGRICGLAAPEVAASHRGGNVDSHHASRSDSSRPETLNAPVQHGNAISRGGGSAADRDADRDLARTASCAIARLTEPTPTPRPTPDTATDADRR
jgi:hypothetical protein